MGGQTGSSNLDREEFFQILSATMGNLTDVSLTSKDDLPAWIFILLNQYVSGAMVFVSVLGMTLMTGNILIIATLAKIGFSEIINISYFALGISDAPCLPFITWHAICYLPFFDKWNFTKEDKSFAKSDQQSIFAFTVLPQRPLAEQAYKS